MKLKVLSYNIHKGFTVRHKAFVLNLIKDSIKFLDLDLVFLQEVVGEHRGFDKHVADWPSNPQFEFLADEVWPHYAYGKNAVYDEGHHGNAILSRFPITRWQNLDISLGRSEPRGVLHCAIAIPGVDREFNCFCTHLGLIRRGRRVQVEQLSRHVQQTIAGDTPHPYLIAGDFNDWERRACALLERNLGVVDVGRSLCGRVQRTYPSFFPLLALDRIYTHDIIVSSVRALRGKPWSKLSDHAPLYAELALPA